MAINQFELQLTNYIHNNERVSLQKCASFFGKSESTIKRALYHLNDYLPQGKWFLLDDNLIISRIHYHDYLALCAISLNEYSTTPEERHQLIIMEAFFNGFTNLSKLYVKLGLSETTRKNDRKTLQQKLKQEGMEIIYLPRKGNTIQGEERLLRIRIAMQLLSIVGLDENDRFKNRQANTPIQRLLADLFVTSTRSYFEETKEKIRSHVFHDEHRSVDYPSKKLIYLYYAISRLRVTQGKTITFDRAGLPEATTHQLFSSDEENAHFDYLVMSLNYKTPLNFPFDARIDKLTLAFIDSVEFSTKTAFYSRYGPYRMLYAYLYKSFIKNRLGYGFYDEHLHDTQKQFHNLYQIVRKMAPLIKDELMIHLQDYQYTDICLILQRYLLRNHVHGTKTKRIVIISNYASEKIEYFIESLKGHFDVELVGYFTINELHQLNELKFDEIITFSYRVSLLLQELGHASRKLPFYLKDETLWELKNAGYVSSHNSKIKALDLARELDAFITLEEKTRYLLQNYSSHFI
ncbi:helix-turn-helix domain-containing protein [Jeotgalibaca sp. A122]|uniref:helix-turn-helix domain-containing protein n=1 Tax=Jeotgalibaca sp. A122 TaxID=3457322 RepID=UPI003FD5F0EF